MSEKKYTKRQLEKMRVAVAGDVIVQIKAGRFVPKVSTGFVKYVEREVEGGESTGCLLTKSEADNTRLQLQKITKKIKKCTVCAKGGLFISAVDLHNQLTVNKAKSVFIERGRDWGESEKSSDHDVTEVNDPSDLITWLFDKEQLDLIEAAFEGTEYGEAEIYDEDADEEKVNPDYLDFSYYDTGTLEESADDRLIAICKNIVANNGTFDGKKFYRRCKDRNRRLKQNRESWNW